MLKIACDLTTVKCTKDARRWLQKFALPATKLRKMLKPRVQAVVTAFCYLCFPCPKFPARLQSPNSDWAWVLKWKFVAPQFLAGVRVELEDIDKEGWILMFFGFFLLINSSSWLTLTEVISAVAIYLLPASKRRKFLPRWICSGTRILRVDSAYRSLLWQQRCSREDKLIKRKKAKNHRYPTFLLNIFQLHSNSSENLWCNKFSL